jgi:hypothetical protein
VTSGWLRGLQARRDCLVRSATEANSYIANGIDLKPGDEMLMTDQEHPGGEQPWQLKAKRYGIVVKKVSLPTLVQQASDVLNLFNDVITARTRVIFFSHITTTTGVVLSAKELCTLARSKEYFVGSGRSARDRMMRLNLQEIGCDMYSSSPQVAAGAERIRLPVCDRRSDRPDVERHRHRRLGRTERARASEACAESWPAPLGFFHPQAKPKDGPRLPFVVKSGVPGYPLSVVSRQPGSGHTYLRTFRCRSRLEINIGRPCLSQPGWSFETMGGSSLLGVTYPRDSLKQR